MKDHVRLLRAIAAKVLQARLSSGARVLDATDFREWLIELAEKASWPKLLKSFSPTFENFSKRKSVGITPSTWLLFNVEVNLCCGAVLGYLLAVQFHL
jgi:hypothetical protein